MKIFIGSSRESEDRMSQVARIIEKCGHTPLRWDDTMLFIAGTYTLEALEDIAKDVDAAVFIFNADDTTWCKKDIVGSVRDNVLIEYGLFCGNLSRKKTCICYVNDPKIPSDLRGLTYIDLSELEDAKDRIKNWLKLIDSSPEKVDDNQAVQEKELLEDVKRRYSKFKQKLVAEAESGSNEARYILGQKYSVGDIAEFDLDLDEAYKWAKLAADDGYAPAQHLLGSMYYRGCGNSAKQDFGESFKWFKRAADNKHFRAFGFVAFMYTMGIGCSEPDFNKAEEYYLKGISLGLIELNNSLGWLYEFYIRDLKKAAECHKQASPSSGLTYYRLGMLYMNGFDGQNPDWGEACKCFTKSSKSGYTDANFQLGQLYYFGRGDEVKRDLKQARKHYEKAAGKGHAEAQYHLIHFYIHGLGCERSDETALMWAKKAVAQGNKFSHNHAGEIYIRQKNYSMAFEMFKWLADRDDGHAQRRLADLYALGLGCEKSVGDALEYYEKAVKRGDVTAKRGLWQDQVDTI